MMNGIFFTWAGAGRAVPRMNRVVAGESRRVRYVILVFSAFYLFIFRGSIHRALAFSPDMLWATGLFWVCGIRRGSVCSQAGYVVGHCGREAEQKR